MKFIHLTPVAVVVVQLGALAVGMASWLDEDDEDGGDPGGEDEFAMDDGDDFDEDFDDEFGSFDDMEEGGDETAGQDSSANELEHRIEELETEVSNVASKANTVRSENEQISESVDEVEENVRKLLEIYEMVTRGVNPFVDDVNAEGMGGGGGQSFGLFDGDGDGETADTDGELDEDITDADADDFFEDDAFDDDFDEDGEMDDEGMGEFDDDEEMDEFDDDEEMDELVDDEEMGEFDDGEEMGEFDDGEEMGEFDNDEMDDFGEFDEDGAEELGDDAGDEAAEANGDGGGTSFDELKEEYESGDADWAEGEEKVDAADANEGGNELVDENEESGLGFDDSDLEENETTGADAEAEAETQVEAETETETEAETEAEGEDGFEFGETADEPTSPPSSGGEDQAAANASPSSPSLGFASRGDGPHLAEPPTGYLADVVALEWLEYLLSEFGAKNTVRTLNYYERIGWIGDPVRDQLFEYLEGLTDSDYIYREEFGSTELTMDDHLESLEYIDELASENIERAVVDRFDDLHRNGIQR